MIKITDFHSHVLPGVDDGAGDVETSLEMLKESRRQGVVRLVATPHYYIYDESPESFLRRRGEAVSRIAALTRTDDYPEIFVGAEVCFDKNIVLSRDLGKLGIVGTKYVLIEMPFRRWDKNEIDALLAIRQNTGLYPVIAHVERYIDFQARGTAEALERNGVILQYNAEYFLEEKRGLFGRSKAEKAVLGGRVGLLGSDAHNMTSRRPNLGPCTEKLRKTVREEFFDDVYGKSSEILLRAQPVNR